MVSEELLAKTLQNQNFSTYAELMQALEKTAEVNRTAKVWLENVIKPVFIMMRFIRAEREGNWPLHLHATWEMLPYFFAAGHVNYAR